VVLLVQIGNGSSRRVALAGANSVTEDSPFIQRLKGYTCLNRIGRPNELSGALMMDGCVNVDQP
jgi:hypothetical protein